MSQARLPIPPRGHTEVRRNKAEGRDRVNACEGPSGPSAHMPADMHPYIHAQKHPDKPAYIMAATGETVTYAQLDDRSNRIAQLFRSLGLQGRRPHRALPREPPALLRDLLGRAARRASSTPRISSRLTAAEVEYIVNDCGAKLFVTSTYLAEKAAELRAADPGRRAPLHDRRHGRRLSSRTRTRSPRSPPSRIADETAGHDMLYSSGTTGRPKGVSCRVVEPQPIDADNPLHADHAQALRHGRGHGLSLAGAALSRRSAALQHGGAAARRHRR